jgi:hypothetical protein
MDDGPHEIATDIIVEFGQGLTDDQRALLRNAIEEALREYGERMANGAAASYEMDRS